MKRERILSLGTKELPVINEELFEKHSYISADQFVNTVYGSVIVPIKRYNL